MSSQDKEDPKTIGLSTIEEIKDLAEVEQKDFSELLVEIKNQDPKIKALWTILYNNIIRDRTNAHVAFIDLYIRCHSKPDMHAIHGQTLAKYLERMEKSNGQLLKLTELVMTAKKESEEQKEEEFVNLKGKKIYEVIQNNK